MRARLLGETLLEPGQLRPASLESLGEHASLGNPGNPHESSRMKRVKVGLEAETVREIDGFAEREDVSRSEMIRRLVKAGLEVLRRS